MTTLELAGLGVRPHRPDCPTELEFEQASGAPCARHWTGPAEPPGRLQPRAPVAQRIRALPSGGRCRRFESCQAHTCDVSGHRAYLCRDIVPCSWLVLRLVVAAGIQGELAQLFPVFGDDPHVQIGDQDQHPDPGVAAAQPDVVQPAVVAQGDDLGAVDLVVADAVVAGCLEPWP